MVRSTSIASFACCAHCLRGVPRYIPLGDLLRVTKQRCLICGSGGTGRRARLRGVWFTLYGFKSRLPHQIRTQNRIQLFVPILRFLLLFRGIFALSRHKKHIFDKRSSSSERFCTFGGWAFLFALNLWVIIKIMVIVKIIVCGRYLVLKMCLFYAII